MIPVALLRSSNLPHAIPGSSGFYYFVEYWLYHASNVSTETQETNTPSELSVAALGFFSDHSSFRSWATIVSGNHINGQYVVPKSQPLHIAATYGLLGIARLLVKGGADVSVVDSLGNTPLFYASYWGSEGMAQLLIDTGADVSAVNNEGETPLHHASRKGHEGVARLLIDRGADVSAANNKGETPLSQASRGGNERAVLELIDKGANLSEANKKGETPLHQACYVGNEGAIRLLIDKGADVSVANNEGETPLSQAARWGNEVVARLLIDSGADVSASDSFGRTPLFQDSLFQLPVDSGTDANAKEGQSALHPPDASEQAGEADISGSEADISGSEASSSGSILSVIESVFSTFASQSSATSISQVPPEARDQAEAAIASALAKTASVSIIVAKGVDKLGQQSVERLIAKALRQFSIATKLSLDNDRPLLRECFSFIEIRAISIARKIRELTQSKSPSARAQTAIKKYLEDTHSYKVPFSERISSWQHSRPDTSDEPLPLHRPQYTSGEEFDKLNEEGEGEGEDLSESSEIKPYHGSGKLGELNEEGHVEELALGENLLQQITEYLASDKVTNDFLCAVKDNFFRV